MTARELMTILKALGAEEVRKGKGSHIRFRAGNCNTTVPAHKGEDIKIGTLRGIVRDLEPALGADWLRRYLERK